MCPIKGVVIVTQLGTATSVSNLFFNDQHKTLI